MSIHVGIRLDQLTLILSTRISCATVDGRITVDAQDAGPVQRARHTLEVLRDIFVTRWGFVLLLCTLVSIGLLFAATKTSGSTHDVYLALATSLFASTVFAMLQALSTARIADEVMRASIHHSVERVGRELISIRSKTSRQFLPIRLYRATDEHDPIFNGDLQYKLANSSCYTFVGITGRFAAAGILRADHRFETVHIYIASPVPEQSLRARVQHIVATEKSTTYAAALERLQSHILESLVGFRDASSKCRRLYVHFVTQPQLNRLEIFDDCVFVGLFSTKGVGKAFPDTLLFSTESRLYEAFASEVRELAEVQDNQSIELKSQMTDEQLAAILVGIGMTSVDIADIRDAKGRFEVFADSFAADCLVDTPIFSGQSDEFV
jgi:hypothetical protein